jgi:hypothetical protein
MTLRHRAVKVARTSRYRRLELSSLSYCYVGQSTLCSSSSNAPLQCSSARSASRLSSLPLLAARLSSTTFTSLPSRTARLEM